MSPKNQTDLFRHDLNRQPLSVGKTLIPSKDPIFVIFVLQNV